MFFTKFGIVVAMDPKQTVFPNIGRTIDMGVYGALGGLVLGVLCEISKNINKQNFDDSGEYEKEG